MGCTIATIVEHLCSELQYLRKELADITQTLLEFIKSTLESGTDALVGGFGKFCVK